MANSIQFVSSLVGLKSWIWYEFITNLKDTNLIVMLYSIFDFWCLNIAGKLVTSVTVQTVLLFYIVFIYAYISLLSRVVGQYSYCKS